MARPKKSDEGASARQRMIDAFWKLIETHRLDELTVNLIVHEAKCNRGTFYYHFTNIDELISDAIEEEYYGVTGIAGRLFNMASGLDDGSMEYALLGVSGQRLSLFIERGGLDLASSKIKPLIFKMWSTVLCPDGSDLKPSTFLLIDYSASGILGLAASLNRLRRLGAWSNEGLLAAISGNDLSVSATSTETAKSSDGSETMDKEKPTSSQQAAGSLSANVPIQIVPGGEKIPKEAILGISRYLLEQIAKAQGIELDELLMRLKMLSQFVRTTGQTQ